MLEIDAFDNADRPRGDKVARNHPHRRIGHRRVRQALAKGRFNLKAQLAGGFLRAIERHRVGDADAVGVFALVAFGLQLLVHLRAKAMHQHNFYAHRFNHR